MSTGSPDSFIDRAKAGKAAERKKVWTNPEAFDDVCFALAVMAHHHQSSPHIGLARIALAKARGERS